MRCRLKSVCMTVCSACRTRSAADDFLSVINPESLVIKQGFAEPSLKDAVAGKAFQFEREGYFCLDSRHSTAEKPVFNRTVGLRDTRAKVGE